MHIYMLLDHYAYVNDALMYDAYIHDPWDLTMLHVCVMHISMIRQFGHGRADGRTNGDPDTRMYDACIHDAAYLSCMYKPRLWCIYTLCMYVLCIYICSLIMYARCIYICSLIMMHMCMMHTSVIFNPWLCCMCVWCGWNFVTNQPTNKAILGVEYHYYYYTPPTVWVPHFYYIPRTSHPLFIAFTLSAFQRLAFKVDIVHTVDMMGRVAIGQ